MAFLLAVVDSDNGKLCSLMDKRVLEHRSLVQAGSQAFCFKEPVSCCLYGDFHIPV